MIGILLVTHGDIGKSLIDCATNILGNKPTCLKFISIKSTNNLLKYQETITKQLEELNNGNGVLVITDIYGATPCNLLQNFIKPGVIEVITGLNLPMLIKALSDRKNNLNSLMNESLECAKKNIKKIELK